MKNLAIWSSLLLLPLLLEAQSDSLVSSLQEELAASTALSNETNTNIDYKPFILSVIDGNELKLYGIATLSEAFKLIPGVDLVSDAINNRTLVIRGSNPQAYGQTKLLIDGVVVNDRTFDSYNPYLDFPIEMIERIEVVRGPGSFVDGVNGYAGTINVITYAHKKSIDTQKGAIFGSLGTYQNRSLGAFDRFEYGEWKISTDLFYHSNEHRSSEKVTDKVFSYGYSNADYAQLGTEQYGFGLNASYDNFSLRGRVNRFESKSAFGNFDALPDSNAYQKLNSWYLQGDYRFIPLNDLSVTLSATIMEDGWESHARSLPSGIYPTSSGFVNYPDGYWGFLTLKNRLLETKGAFKYKGFDKHTITGGYSHKYEKAIDMSSVTTQKTGGTLLVDYTNSAPFFNADDAQRHINEFYLSDYFQINDAWAFSFTGGYLDSSSISNLWYGRGAIVYQPDVNDMYKLMAGNSYRLPSWQEMYVANNPSRIGNPSLKEEEVQSIDAQYIHKFTPELNSVITVFYAKNSDQIKRDTTNTFQNMGDNTTYGAEFELNGKLQNDTSFRTSYSYVEGTGVDTLNHSCDIPLAASHLLKGAITHTFESQWSISGIGNYIGSKKRLCNDTREDLSSYTTLDLSLGWNTGTSKGWYTHLSLLNATNEDIRYPAPANTYPNDYLIQGRTLILHGGWRF